MQEQFPSGDRGGRISPGLLASLTCGPPFGRATRFALLSLLSACNLATGDVSTRYTRFNNQGFQISGETTKMFLMGIFHFVLFRGFHGFYCPLTGFDKHGSGQPGSGV